MAKIVLFLTDDDGIPPMNFYGKLKSLAKQVTLKDAEDVVTVLPDSDVEDETENQRNKQVEEDVGEESDFEQEIGSEREREFQEDDEDNIPLSTLKTTLRTNKINKKSEKRNVIWKKTQFVPPNITFNSPEVNQDLDQNETPLGYFSKYFQKEIYLELAETTNMYSIQKTGRNINTNPQEMRKLVALHIVMGIIRFPRLRMYWTPATKIKFFEDIQMPRNRFEALRNNLHIVDINQKPDEGDKLWKVRPIIQSFEKRCEELQIEENLCIDESIIPFKGQLRIKQYIKGKPNPWGVKIFMLCGATGLIYRSIVYQGATTLSTELQETYSATNGLVMHLASRIPENKGHKL